MDSKKKIIIAAIIVVIIAIIAGIAVTLGVNNNNTKDDASQEQVKVTPTFMYFVSKSDDDYDKAMSVVESLKVSYGEKIKFDIVDVDENPDAKKNFPVEGQTPVLIMLNTSNDISDFKFKCSDEEELKMAIEAALQ